MFRLTEWVVRAAVYVETTIFSFYYDRRTSPAVVAMREWTRDWWTGHAARYDVATSTAVLAELEAGTLAHRDEALAMALALPALSVDSAIEDIVRVYVERHVMPRDPLGDALHLALACFHKFDYLLTWNCRHLANANKFAHTAASTRSWVSRRRSS
jgi:hypothetical protein